MVEVNVAAEVGAAVGIGSPHHVSILNGVGPAFGCHCPGQVLVLESHAGVFCRGVITAIEEQWEVGVGTFVSSVGVDGDEHIEVVGFHFGRNLGEAAVEDIQVGGGCFAKLALCAIIFVVRAVLDAGHDDIVLQVASGAGGGVVAGLIERTVKFEAVLYEAFEYTEALLEVGIGLKEAQCIGVCARECAVSYERAGTVIGSPAAVSGVDVHAQFVGSLGADGDGGCKCQGRQDDILFHNVYCALFGECYDIQFAFGSGESDAAAVSAGAGELCLDCVVGDGLRNAGSQVIKTQRGGGHLLSGAFDFVHADKAVVAGPYGCTECAYALYIGAVEVAYEATAAYEPVYDFLSVGADARPNVRAATLRINAAGLAVDGDVKVSVVDGSHGAAHGLGAVEALYACFAVFDGGDAVAVNTYAAVEPARSFNECAYALGGKVGAL